MLPTATPTPFVATNFTSGFANDRLLTLNYPQQFSCPDQFNEDLSYTKDGSGIDIPAQSNPADFQTPICQLDNAGIGGFPVYALIPMFSTNNDTNPDDAIACNPAFPADTLCGPALGSALITWFGDIPEAFKQAPTVAVQCPNPRTF